MNARWKRNRTCVYNIGYHIIWCPKYRRKVLTGVVEERLRQLLIVKALELQIEICSIEIMSDHVHLFVKCDPTDSPHFIVQQFKGFSSRILRQEFDSLKTRLPTLWTRSYYCESVGHISESTIVQYIQNQKNI